jgi:hypothetical protein
MKARVLAMTGAETGENREDLAAEQNTKMKSGARTQDRAGIDRFDQCSNRNVTTRTNRMNIALTVEELKNKT